MEFGSKFGKSFGADAGIDAASTAGIGFRRVRRAFYLPLFWLIEPFLDLLDERRAGQYEAARRLNEMKPRAPELSAGLDQKSS
ncbi:hypothetical protein [Bordetella genomosp. 9]|uniref:hypothetical protein n=1 Tax=Bordetella genomosp. 9 TaxID=1416803 RepID=UPI0012FA08E7|nr:hypothetical protein [Bordetella genomosp. 9]